MLPVLVFAISPVLASSSKPLVEVSKFDGKFQWFKVASLPAASVRSLASAKAISVTLNFPQGVSLKKDRNGNVWFTLLVADQGSDWKWHQTSGFGAIPLSGGTVRAGSCTISVPVAGIPSAVLKGNKQTVSVGASASGIAKPIRFSITSISGR